MKKIKYRTISPLVYIFLVLMVFSCKEEEETYPITNDLRVLQVKAGDEITTSGVTDISVIEEFLLIFSHGLNSSAFEQGLTITPSIALTVSYDDSKSFATISFTDPLAYETDYTITLAKGAYGAKGEESVEDFNFSFTTAAFEAPGIKLSSDVSKIFEGDTALISVTIDRAILENVSVELVFSGTAAEGVDYTISEFTVVIPSGSTSGSVELVSKIDGETEGEEIVTVNLGNLVNAVEDQPQQLDLILNDSKPALELRGVMELEKFRNGTEGRVRAVQLKVLEDIPDLGIYGIEVASNGAAPDPNAIDYMFPSGTGASAGDNLFVVRDADVADAQLFFGDCYSEFVVFETVEMTQNGDDAILLYNNGTAIESFGEPGVDGTDTYWDYSDSWAYKLNDEWIYAGVGCVANGGGETNATNSCKYPFCTPVQLTGVSSLLWDGSGTNGGKFVQVRINRDIADLSRYGLGVANNGGGTDGIEYTFPNVAAKEGDHILIAREPETIASFLGNCYNNFDHVFQSEAMTQNGDDAIELFDGDLVVETFGDALVDGTGQIWDYAGSWAFLAGGSWSYGGLDCAATATSNSTSACPYPFCD